MLLYSLINSLMTLGSYFPTHNTHTPTGPDCEIKVCLDLLTYEDLNWEILKLMLDQLRILLKKMSDSDSFWH